MARINVEERWWIDIRRSALIRMLNDEEKADGAAIRLWRAGIEYWKKGEAIPKQCFDLLPCASELLKCALAEERGASIYVKGASECFNWITKKAEAGRKGGRKSVEKRRNTNGTAQPISKQTRSSPEANSSNPKHFQPSSSSSSSSSSSESNNTIVGKSKKGMQGIRIEYPDNFNKIWNAYGKRGDKKEAYVEFKNANLSQEELQNLDLAIKNYCETNEWGFRLHLCRFLKTDWREHIRHGNGLSHMTLEEKIERGYALPEEGGHQ